MSIDGKVVRIYNIGGSEVLKYENIKIQEPGAREIRLRHKVIGLNFIDINMRKGSYPINAFLPDAKAPYVLGMEGAGEIESIGKEVHDFKVGDRVTHCMNLGTYSEIMNVDSEKVICLPDNISYETAAACTLQGLTAHYLVNELWKLEPEHCIVVHSAAGGVGNILCQWAKHIGATVIGVISSEQKAQYAQSKGADYTINITKEGFSKKVKEITKGKGADVIYDAVGKDTFEEGLSCLASRGRIVSYGVSSGPIDPININFLRPLSASIACGGLLTFIKDSQERDKNAKELFDLISSGKLIIDINQKYKLDEISKAHDDLSSRLTTGSSIVMP